MASPPWKPKPLVLRVEIEPEHVEALGGLLSPGATGTPRLRAVEHDDPALVRREAALADREARLEEAERRVADVEIREERLETWRAELTELEKRLDRKEAELLVYVAQLQEEFVRREGSGWRAVASHIRH